MEEELRCRLCETATPIADEEDARAARVCGKHLRVLGRLEQRLNKWAMQAPRSANALHALSCPPSQEWCYKWFLDIRMVDALLEFLLQRGHNPQLGGQDATPLDDALAAAIDAAKRLGDEDLTELELRRVTQEVESRCNILVKLVLHVQEKNLPVDKKVLKLVKKMVRQAGVLIAKGGDPQRDLGGDGDSDSEGSDDSEGSEGSEYDEGSESEDERQSEEEDPRE